MLWCSDEARAETVSTSLCPLCAARRAKFRQPTHRSNRAKQYHAFHCTRLNSSSPESGLTTIGLSRSQRAKVRRLKFRRKPQHENIGFDQHEAGLYHAQANPDAARRARAPQGRIPAMNKNLRHAALHAAAVLLTAGSAATQTRNAAPPPGSQVLWHGLTLAAETPCTRYHRNDYRYRSSIEADIAAEQGGLYSPYTGREFQNIEETDIDHIVALSEAADSGLCDAPDEVKIKFASDPANLALAAPETNRHEKRALDAAGWLPAENRCWFAGRVIEVKRRYQLTIDPAEAAALDRVLATCSPIDMIRQSPPTSGALTSAQAAGRPPAPAPVAARNPTAAAVRPAASEPADGNVDPSRWDDNGNGRITCGEAQRHGIAPVRRGDPAYSWMRDPDGDGIICATGRRAGARVPSAPMQSPVPPTGQPADGNVDPSRWDDNGNGRITCAEARRHGIAPVRRGHPAYAWMRDPNGDGVICE